MFQTKFSAVSCYPCDADVTNNNDFSPNSSFKQRLTDKQVKSVIQRLKIGLGFDGIHSNHFKFCSNIMIFYFTKFFNACIIHNYIPEKMLKGVITPRLKNKLNDVEDSNNYMEVMVSSNIFKLFEYCLLPLIVNNTDISDRQFGYRKQTSTTLATLILKETVNRYITEGSRVYSCFLDLSRAFERIDHKTLLFKLEKKGVPMYLVNVLKTIFLHTTVSVHFNGV